MRPSSGDWLGKQGFATPHQGNLLGSTQGEPSGHYIPVFPNKLLNLLDIGELMENTGVDEPRDVD